MVFTMEELNLIREWFNVVEDVSPKYLEQRDRNLGRRIEEFCRLRDDDHGQGVGTMRPRDEWGPADHAAVGFLIGAGGAATVVVFLMLWAFLYKNGYWPFHS